MSSSTIVPALRIQAVCGDTLYPGENGFSTVWGEVESEELALTQLLDQSLQNATPVALRCGVLEVVGTLHTREIKGTTLHYRIQIQKAQYGSGPSNGLPPNKSLERTREG
jgi:hypothetical protein